MKYHRVLPDSYQTVTVVLRVFMVHKIERMSKGKINVMYQDFLKKSHVRKCSTANYKKIQFSFKAGFIFYTYLVMGKTVINGIVIYIPHK